MMRKRLTSGHEWACEGGLALTTLLVAVVVLGALTLGLGYALSHYSDARQRDAFVRAEARELALLAKAVGEEAIVHAESYAAAWYDGQAHAAPGIDEMIDPDKVLPAGFAKRFGSLGVSPLNQPYQALAYGFTASDGSKLGIGWLVLESGQATQGLLSRAGVDPSSDASRLAFKRTVALAAGRDFALHAGIIAPGSLHLVAIDGGWDIDLGSTFGVGGSLTTSSWPRVAVLVNHPMLDGQAPHDGEGPTAASAWDRFVFVAGRANNSAHSGVDAVCPPGTQEVASFPACGYDPDSYLIYDTPAGPITFSQRVSKPSYGFDGEVTNRPCDEVGKPACYRRRVRLEGMVSERDVLLSQAQIGTDGVCQSLIYEQGKIWINPNLSPGDPAYARCRSPGNSNQYDWSSYQLPIPWDGCVVSHRLTSSAPYAVDRLCGVPANAN